MTLYDVVDVIGRAHEERRDLHKERTMKAYFQLREWQGQGLIEVVSGGGSGLLRDTDYPNEMDEHLAMVCGYVSSDDMADNWRDETKDVLAGLAGPHGWTIYRMLLARRGGG